MYIGKLEGFEICCTKINSTLKPEVTTGGDSFLNIEWEKLNTAGIDIHVKAAKESYINNAIVYLGEESEPTSLSVYTKNKERLIYEHHAETGKSITEKKIVLSIEKSISEFIIECKIDFSDIIIDKIELYGACFEGEKLYPTPLEYTKKESDVKVCDLNTVFSENDDAVKILKEKLEEVAGITLKDSDDGKIKLINDSGIAKNGYHLNVSNDEAVIKASDLKGFVQGVETFIKLISNGKVECCEINDAPFCDFRGTHLYLPAEDQMDFAKRLIKYILSPMGYNNIILEVAGAMQYESHPEINEAFENAVQKGKSGEWPKFPHGGVGGGKTVSKKSIRDFVAYARGFGIDVIPEIQSLGHVQFMTLAHPDIAEVSTDYINEVNDERSADIPPSDFYAHSFCPSNPKSYEILFDLMEEIIDTFEPTEYVHMGHDEVYQLGICPKCKDKIPSQLFADDINKLHSFLAKKGLKMMIWGDMLQSISKYKIGKYKCYEAMDRIPKDIVLLDFIWYFFPDKDIEDTLLSHNFNVIYGNMYSSHFPRYETRIRKKGIMGGEVSTWVQTNESILAREGKLYDFIYAAQMLWSESYSQYNRYSYDKVICEIIPRLREQIKNKKYPSLSGNAKMTDIRLGDINGKFDSIIFEHTASDYIRRIPWAELEVVASYTISYADGTEENIPVTYGGNICWSKRRHNEPFAAMYYRHNGYTATWDVDAKVTEDGTVYCYEWINPKPETAIRKISFNAVFGAETNVIIHKIVGVN